MPGDRHATSPIPTPSRAPTRQTPLRAAALAARGPRRSSLPDELGAITCPLLSLTSPQDHVVDPGNSDVLAAGGGGPVERIALERSYHVATLDYDGPHLLRSRPSPSARSVAPDAATAASG